MNVLDIYVAKLCFGCEEALILSAEINKSLPYLQVKVKNLDKMMWDDLPEIIATPSYFLNGRLLFLGNPRLEELVAKITSLSNN